MTDKLRLYGVAHRELIPETIHSSKQYENNRVEQSREASRAQHYRDLRVGAFTEWTRALA